MERSMKTSSRTLDDRFQTAAEGLLFVLIGVLALPSANAAAVAVVGALLLGLNVARVGAGVRVGWLSIAVGAWAVIGGVGTMAGLKIDAFALFFLVLGIMTIGAAALRSR